MKDTLKSLLESATIPSLDVQTRNTLAYNGLSKFTEAGCLEYTPQKVIINKSRSGYVVEFTGNLERLMRDQDMEIDEAMETVASLNDIPIEECTVLFDEAAINIIDINKVQILNPEFRLAAK